MLKWNIWILLICSFIATTFYTQNITKINELKYQIQIENNVNKKADQLIELSKLLEGYNYTESINYAYEGLTLSKSLHYNQGKIAAYYQISNVEKTEGNYEKAIESIQLANEINEAYGDQKGLAISNIYLGYIYIDLEDYESARIYFQYALDIGSKIRSNLIQTKANAGFGLINSRQQKYYLAEQYYLLAIETIRNTIQYEEIGHVYEELATIQALTDNNEDAITNFQIALKNYEKLDLKSKQAKVCYDLGVLYQKINESEDAIVFMKNSLGLAQESGMEELIKKGYQTIATTYEKNDQFQDAYEYLKYYSAIKDTKEISELESQLELEMKNKELAILTKEKDFHKKESDNQKLYIIISVIVLIIIFCLSIFLFISLRQRDKINSQLIVAKDLANLSKQEKEDFFAYTSHEIRTPLNAVVGMANLLSKTNLDKSQTKYLQTITGSAQNILFLVNDVLDISKIEKGGVEFEQIEFSLHQIIDQIIDSLEFKKFEKKVSLIQNIAPNVPKVLIGDPIRFNQILLNLADNALKFTKEGSVSINVIVSDKIDDKVRIHFSVEDTGIGIQQEKLDSIFNSYQQEHASITRQYGGTGLGLAISKLLVENMGGEIKVKSEIGIGTKFYFSIWIPTSEMKEVSDLNSKQGTDVEKLSNLSILVVDDNQLNREVFYDLVEDKEQNVNLTLAENGQVAIDKLNQNDFDLILMDIQMPVMDGYEATKTIRSNPDFTDRKRNIPIIAMTAHVLEGVAEKCIAVGMQDAISKPVNINVLNQKIRNALNLKSDVNKEDISPSTVSTQSSIINLENLKSISKNKPEKLKKYIDMFLKNIPTDFSTLKEAENEKKWKDVKTYAHKIKGSLGYMGVTSIQSEIIYLEQLDITNIDENEIKIKVDVIEKEIMLILIELKEIKF
jgi:signal transduction histidine kinase/CheY-like chemotaxis protein/HPt (histidine-containing phosphotransfer) domain-containing protein